jgi:hypothetical protein
VERFGSEVFGPPDHDAGGWVTSSALRVNGARQHGNETDIDRQGSGRRIEGRGPWAYR